MVLKLGIADMGWINTGLYSGKFSFAEASTLPFMFPNAEVGSKVTWEIFNKYPEIRAQWQDNIILATWTSDPCFFVGVKKFYKTLDDIRGNKIGVSGINQAHFLSAFGAAAIYIPSPDWHAALEKGVIDGILINAGDYVRYQIYEVAPYISYVPTTCEYHAIAMNINIWNSFSTTIQNQIMSVAGETASAQFSSDVFDKAKTDMIPSIESTGHTVFEYTLSDNETQALMVVSKDLVWDEWVLDQTAKGLTNAQQILDDTLTLSQNYSSSL